MIVAIDGPSGSGKSTVSKEVAARLGFHLLDTGALYRGAGLLAAEAGVAPEDGAAVAKLIEAARFEFRSDEGGAQRLFIDDRDVSRDIRTPAASEAASLASAQPAVRAALLDLQRSIGRSTDCVVEGRDIGTVVFPEAEKKFFLTASTAERVRRRKAQYEESGRAVSDDELYREVLERDERDSSRDVAPLAAAPDAVLLDSTVLDFDEVVERIVAVVRAG
jgi:cytidylate kinase